jgi:hypothetical protein
VPSIDEVLRESKGSTVVVEVEHVGVGSLDVRVDEAHGPALPDDRLHVLRVEFRRHDDEPVDALIHRLDRSTELMSMTVRRRDHKETSAVLSRRVETVQKFSEELTAHVGQEHAEPTGLFPEQAERCRIGLVAQRSRRLQHRPLFVLSDRARGVEHARNGGYRDTRQAGDIVDRSTQN